MATSDLKNVTFSLFKMLETVKSTLIWKSKIDNRFKKDK